MKLKEIERTANQAWSPAGYHPILLATGKCGFLMHSSTCAQQLDASFSTNATLEVFELDLQAPKLEMEQKALHPAETRFHKLIWGSFGTGTVTTPGIIVGGGDNGILTLYDAAQILSSGKDPVLGHSEKHSGPVRALDFNCFQNNLLASGANDSEIFIWDLNNFSTPMTPGAKVQHREPLEDVRVVAWNRQVQHILASAHPSGKAVVWDLRKNEPIIKVSDHSNRMHCSGMAWNPDVATQLVLSSEDDRMPVIQVWDLRFATSPLKVLENHRGGILSVSWCQADADLLLSSAKDNRILCWSVSSGEVVYELPTSRQWCFDVQWCPRNPALLSTASFDGHISVYSIMGGSLEAQQQSQADQISSSFNNLDLFGTGKPLPPLDICQQVASMTHIPPLKKPPRWIQRPVGASFAFGGKLITFVNPKISVQQIQNPISRQVVVSQVVTETEFLKQSNELQLALHSDSIIQYCQTKVQTVQSDFERNVWNFLKVNFEQDARTKFLKLLGYSKEKLDEKICSIFLAEILPSGLYCALGIIQMKQLQQGQQDAGLQFQEQQARSQQQQQMQMSVMENHQLELEAYTICSIFGNELHSASPPLETHSAQISEDSSPSESSSSDFFAHVPKEKPEMEIPVTADVEGLISQALLTGDFQCAVDLCLNDGRFAEAIILAVAGGEELLKKTQKRYFERQCSKLSPLMYAVVNQRWQDIAESCSLSNWKEAMAALLTYSRPEEYSRLCDILGHRLETEGDENQCVQACLCYITSGNVEKMVECWVRNNKSSSPLALQALVEKAMILKKSVDMLQESEVPVQGQVLAEKLTQYSSLLAAQGSLAAAMTFLPTASNERLIMQLRDRLFHAHEDALPDKQAPPFPYVRVQIKGMGQPAVVAVQQEPENKADSRATRQGIYETNASPVIPAELPVKTVVPPTFTPRLVPAASSAPPPVASPATAGASSRVGPHPAYPSYSAVISGPASGIYKTNTSPVIPAELPVKTVVPPTFTPRLVPAASSAPPPVASPATAGASSRVGPHPAYPSHSAVISGPAYSQTQQFGQPRPAVFPSHSGITAFPPQPPVPSSGLSGPSMAASSSIVSSVPHTSAVRYTFQPSPQSGAYLPPVPGQVQSSASTVSASPSLFQPYGADYPHGGPGAPASNSAIISAVPPPKTGFIPWPETHCDLTGLRDGWNDPPTVHGGIRKKKLPENFPPPAPITTPVMNLQAEHPLQHQDLLPQDGILAAPGAPMETTFQAIQQLPAEKIQQKEIPEEHLYLKVCFDGLLRNCLQTAKDPQTKRKLEDANKRIEHLYIKLREQTLSKSILNGLHEIAHCVESRHYSQALHVHTQVVSSSNFSEISSFMPVLKVVVTIANKLNI
ncbi:protein transport protein Sec31B [Protopterus annectens]|uniref:protein transport protein Sec31B n=1 Tax=Protopterus annectens TaxID=7888 RepID=UPI001CFA8450|nr:protein transport protein Sec31B [Protopterus annectens]